MKEQTDLNKYCLVVGSTDVGRKRAANEDYMGNFDTCNGLVSVVCDGMGGHVGGATASHIAVDTIRKFMEEQYYNDPREAIGMAIEMANKAILAEAAARPELCGMGSTCVLLLIREGKVYLGHVGDSRIYLIRTNTITQLTKDHSYVQMLVDCGKITKEQAEQHPRKNEITNALGIPDMTPATVMEEAITPDSGDCFLLCSDGLSGMVSDKEILSIVSKQKEMGTQERADCLVQRANEHGGLDNITVQLVEFASVPKSNDNTSFFKQKKFWVSIVLALLLIGGGVSTWLLLKKNSALQTNSDAPNIANTEQSSNFNGQREQYEKNIGSVSWTSDFKFIIIRYHKEYAEIILQQKASGKVGIDELNKIEIPGEFNVASLVCRNEGVDYGSEGSDYSWIGFKKGEKNKPINPEIQFTLTAKDGMVHSFKVSVITEGQKTSETAVSTTVKDEPEESTKMLEKLASTINNQIAPTIYEISFSLKNISESFLLVYKDKYKSGEGNEAQINLGMKLPTEKEAIQKPDYVNVQWDNNCIRFSFINEENIPEEFSITLKTVEEENTDLPVNIKFNCKQKQ